MMFLSFECRASLRDKHEALLLNMRNSAKVECEVVHEAIKELLGREKQSTLLDK